MEGLRPNIKGCVIEYSNVAVIEKSEHVYFCLLYKLYKLKFVFVFPGLSISPLVCNN